MNVEILNKIGNKKLIAAFEENNMKSFGEIASKLYVKARSKQDKKEFLLAECLKYSRNEELNVDQALNKFHDINAQEAGMKAMIDVQSSEKYMEETDSLRKYDMRETAYENARNSAKI
jgi:hypothetical protein